MYSVEHMFSTFQSVADIGDSLINNIKPEFWKNDTNVSSNKRFSDKDKVRAYM